jgi:hypothetical protein
MLNWLYIVSISAAAIATISFLARRRIWSGPYGLTLETRASLKALSVAGIALLLSAPLSMDVLELPGQWRIGFAAAFLLIAAYSSALALIRGK